MEVTRIWWQRSCFTARVLPRPLRGAVEATQVGVQGAEGEQVGI